MFHTKYPRTVFAFLVYFTEVSSVNAQDIKTWRMDTNFLNPRNWDNGQLPCENDRIIFPDARPVVTYMPESLALAEMVLPMNGEVIFPSNAALELTGGKKAGACVGKNMHFRTTTDYWFQPTNWNITSRSAFPRIPSRRNLAVPHAFQVPCPMDAVHFPPEKTFQVTLDYPMVSVGSMNINGKPYTNDEFNTLLRTQTGSLLFPGNPTIQITQSSCSDDSGCMCGNDEPRVLPTICLFAASSCSDPKCSDPIQPVGNCCPICGAQLLIELSEGFNLDQMLKLHDSFMSKEEYIAVESFTAKTYDSKIQSVFVDGGEYKGKAREVAQLIHDALKSDMKRGVQLYKIRSIEINTSEKWKAGVPTYDSRFSEGLSTGGKAGLVILILACLGCGISYYIYRKRHVPGFDFARFDLRGDKIELQLGTTPHEELEPEDEPSLPATSQDASGGFENLLYGAKVDEVCAEESVEDKSYVENPMFMTFDDVAPSSSKG